MQPDCKFLQEALRLLEPFITIICRLPKGFRAHPNGSRGLSKKKHVHLKRRKNERQRMRMITMFGNGKGRRGERAGAHFGGETSTDWTKRSWRSPHQSQTGQTLLLALSQQKLALPSNHQKCKQTRLQFFLVWSDFCFWVTCPPQTDTGENVKTKTNAEKFTLDILLLRREEVWKTLEKIQLCLDKRCLSLSDLPSGGLKASGLPGWMGSGWIEGWQNRKVSFREAVQQRLTGFLPVPAEHQTFRTSLRGKKTFGPAASPYLPGTYGKPPRLQYKGPPI